MAVFSIFVSNFGPLLANSFHGNSQEQFDHEQMKNYEKQEEDEFLRKVPSFMYRLKKSWK